MQIRGALVVGGIRVAPPQSPPRQLTLLFERYWEDRGLSARPGHLILHWYRHPAPVSWQVSSEVAEEKQVLAPSPEL